MDGVRTMKLPLHLNMTQDPERGKEKLKDIFKMRMEEIRKRWIAI